MPPESAVPPAVADLLGALPTMVHIELLLLLDRAAPSVVSVDSAATELRADLQLVWVAAEDLRASGLALRGDRRGEVRLAPGQPKVRTAIAALRDEYERRPVTLIKALYKRPVNALHAFADAFRLRGEE